MGRALIDDTLVACFAALVFAVLWAGTWITARLERRDAAQRLDRVMAQNRGIVDRAMRLASARDTVMEHVVEQNDTIMGQQRALARRLGKGKAETADER